MRQGSRKAAVLLIVLAIFLLTCCSSGNQAAGADEAKRIIFIYKTTLATIEFWQSMTAGVEAGAEEFGYQYRIMGAVEEPDVEGSIRAVEEAVALEPDVIVISATDSELLMPAAQKVLDAGILLLTVDSDVAGNLSRCFVATDNFVLGQHIGEEMNARTGPGGKIAVVAHMENSFTASERVRGAEDALNASGGKVILPPVYCENRWQIAQANTLQLLKEHPDITGIMATNETSGIGVAMAVAEAGRQDDVVVVTCDSAAVQISYLEQGVIDATIVQRPFNMGYFCVQFADMLLKNKNDTAVPLYYDTGCDVITIENYLTPENQKLLFPFKEGTE